MAEVSITKLAADINTSVDRLIKQLADAGIKKRESDSVTEDEKRQLLEFLKKQHGADEPAEPKRMTLQRKTTSTLNAGGKSKGVKVEVRKKRTYVKRSDVEEQRKAEEERQKKAEEEEQQLKEQAAGVVFQFDSSAVEFCPQQSQSEDRVLPAGTDKLVDNLLDEFMAHFPLIRS